MYKTDLSTKDFMVVIRVESKKVTTGGQFIDPDDPFKFNKLRRTLEFFSKNTLWHENSCFVLCQKHQIVQYQAENTMHHHLYIL